MSDDGGVIEDAPGASELSVTGVNGVRSEEHGRSDNSMISIATIVVLMLSHDLQYTTISRHVNLQNKALLVDNAYTFHHWQVIK